MVLIEGKFYECKEDLVLDGTRYFSKGRRYKAINSSLVFDDNGVDVNISGSVFDRYFDHTPYDQHGNPVKKTLADEAYDLIGGDRQEEYGDMRKSFENIGKVWSVLLGVEVSAEKVALMMVGLKMVRQNNKHKRDNLVDLVGYTALLGRLEGEE